MTAPSRLGVQHTQPSHLPPVRPPTSFLPPLARLLHLSIKEIEEALNELNRLYWPPISPPASIINSIPEVKRPKDNSHAQRGHLVIPDSGYASAEDDDIDLAVSYSDQSSHEVGTDADDGIDSATNDSEPELDPAVLRSDELERTYAIKWITGFVARSDKWVFGSDDDEETEQRTNILDLVTKILSAFSGDEGDMEVSVTRTFTFTTPCPSARSCVEVDSNTRTTTISVELNDAPLLSTDHTSVGLQSWGSSILLSERLCATPGRFSILPRRLARTSPALPSPSTLRTGSPQSHDHSLQPPRILELGAGTGLLSIVAGKIIQLQNQVYDATSSQSPLIVATDFHPDVLENLRSNIKTNFPLSSYEHRNPKRPPIDVHTLDWETPVYNAPLDNAFDVILAADVVYHPEHACWIKMVVEDLLIRPSISPEEAVSDGKRCGGGGGLFWMIIALRSTGRHEGLESTVDNYFPEARQLRMKYARDAARCTWKLAVLEKEEVEKVDGVGRADEGGYNLYKIGWAPCVDA